MSSPRPPTPPLQGAPPEAWTPLVRMKRIAVRPLERFLRVEAASGIVLLVAAAVALTLANSAWADWYAHLWHTPIALGVGALRFERSLEWFVNDGLMVIFFFVVGMEIRREIHHGELSVWKRAVLPVAAAAGGMVAPAVIYLALVAAPNARSGWGVPMATDIAFAVGVLTLLGSRVPAALRVLLLALAVIDDLGAIVVIALFYSAGLNWLGVLAAFAGIVVILGMQRAAIRSKAAYIPPALVVWLGTYAAGIHPTIAGVIVGLLTPVRAWLGSEGFVTMVREQLELLRGPHPAPLHDLNVALRHVEIAQREALSPATSLIERLHPWVAFGIMPLFALANAGVQIPGSVQNASSLHTVTIATFFGLFIGKPLGILAATWVTVRLRVAALPAGITLRHLTVLGVVAGIGFTMALFIAQLAFREAELISAAKLGVIIGSLAAGVSSVVLGRVLLPDTKAEGAAETADDAECSTDA